MVRQSSKKEKWNNLLAKKCVGALLIACATFGLSAHSARADGHVKPMDGFTFSVDSRYRFEHVDQDPILETARASTWRNRLGVITPWISNLARIAVEGEGVLEIGPDNFNNTINGNGQFPVVVDVESIEVNQAYLELKAAPGVTLIGGRFRKNLENQRFIGSVGWRQNDQTYDGASADITSIPDTEIYYAWIGNVNRIFSDRAERPPAGGNIGNLSSNIHVVEANYKGLSFVDVTVFNYYLDLFDLDALSSNTVGVRFKSKFDFGGGFGLKHYAEYAYQSDVGDNPVEYETYYYHIAPTLYYKNQYGWAGVTVGYEVLGSDDGAIGFSTPLATLHKFNGFADVFLATPANGLEDIYVDLTLKPKGLPGVLSFLNGSVFKAQYHDFESNVGSVQFGQEFDLYAKIPLKFLPKGFYAETKYAVYEADTFATNRDKLIVGLGYKAKYNGLGF